MSKNKSSFKRFCIVVVYIAVVVVSFYVLVVGFTNCGLPKPPVDPSRVDAGTAEDCPAACENMGKMKCPGWEGSSGSDEEFGTEDDVSCEEVCRGIMNESTGNLFPLCTAKAEDCDEVDACFE